MGKMADLYARIEQAADFASSNIEPELLDRTIANNITADNGGNPLPSHADYSAGAMALMLAIIDQNE